MMSSLPLEATNLGSRADTALGSSPSLPLDLGTVKPCFKIREVAEILGVASHVLRYWEQEFSSVRPRKSRGGQRIYRKSDIAALLRIKHLLYERQFTIAGARAEMAKSGSRVPMAAPDLRYRLRQSLSRVQVQLDTLKALLRPPVDPAKAADPAAYLRRFAEEP